MLILNPSARVSSIGRQAFRLPFSISEICPRSIPNLWAISGWLNPAFSRKSRILAPNLIATLLAALVLDILQFSTVGYFRPIGYFRQPLKSQLPMNSAAYESLHVISQATEQITEHIERLKIEGLLRPEQADLRKSAIEQLRAEISFTAVLNLADRESEDASRLEQERIKREER